ncbi:MAG: hypothetical protein KDC48_20820, partial [Planctomycetes bacterium]|nr:hypothetical protein [Planctomycetota bacterium]
MNTQNTAKKMLVVAMTAAAGLCQQPAPQVVAARAAGFAAVAATQNPLLELRLAGRETTRLELRGGTPGAPAQIVLGRQRDASPAGGSGFFDGFGCFSVEVNLAAYAGGTFVGQGFAVAPALDGSL